MTLLTAVKYWLLQRPHWKLSPRIKVFIASRARDFRDYLNSDARQPGGGGSELETVA